MSEMMDFVNENNLNDIFLKSYSLRGIFDPYCSEWDWLPMKEKLAYLNSFLKYTSFSHLIELYSKSGFKDYITHEIPAAVFELSKYSLEARDYLKNNEECGIVKYRVSLNSIRKKMAAEFFAESLLEKAGL